LKVTNVHEHPSKRVEFVRFTDFEQIGKIIA